MPVFMLHAGLDLSRRRLDVCLLSGSGEPIKEFAAPADVDGLRGLARRVGGQPVRAVIESMNGARFVHDTLARSVLPRLRTKIASARTVWSGSCSGCCAGPVVAARSW